MVVECQGMVYGITNSYNLENAAVAICGVGFLVSGHGHWIVARS